VELFKASQGLDFAILAAMAVLGAPVFEELVFRGFLQNSVSASLKRWKLRRLLGGHKRATALVAQRMPDLDKMVPALRGTTLRAEILVGLASALVFSVMHLQLHPVTLVMLFGLGLVHSELYRRTGSLYCSMLLHFVNNGIAVAVLLLSR
jgi:membrane protease YdiL (CAAX protease family)